MRSSCYLFLHSQRHLNFIFQIANPITHNFTSDLDSVQHDLLLSYLTLSHFAILFCLKYLFFLFNQIDGIVKSAYSLSRTFWSCFVGMMSSCHSNKIFLNLHEVFFFNDLEITFRFNFLLYVFMMMILPLVLHCLSIWFFSSLFIFEWGRTYRGEMLSNRSFVWSVHNAVLMWMIVDYFFEFIPGE